MKTTIEVSLRDTSKAFWAIDGCHQISDRLEQTYSNVWESVDDFNLDEEDDKDAHFNLVEDIRDLFRRAGVTEYTITENHDKEDY